MRKSIFFAALAALMLVSVSASAQSTQIGNGSVLTDTNGAEKVFNTFDLTYSPVKLTFDFGIEYNVKLNGVSLNWSQYRLVTNKLPLYLQYGAGLQYAWGEFSFFGLVTPNINILSARVPVNAVYKLALPNTSLVILPYVGLNLQGYFLGKGKSESDVDDGYNEDDSYYESDYDDGSLDIFNKEDMDGDPLNRIVLGWQIGAKVMYDRYIFGVGYEGPVTNLYKEDVIKVRSSQVNITLGIKF